VSYRFSALLLAVALIAAACGAGGAAADPAESTTVESTSSTVVSSVEPTTTAAVVVSPPTSRGLPEPVRVDPLPASMRSVTVVSGNPAYRGVLGQIDPDRIVVAPVALPPAPAAEGIAPLTGLPLSDPSVADRPAILAKIDNTPKGRPQAGISQADMVYEEQIEGGFTRLAVVFHTNAPAVIGPVRSGRSTDIALLGSLNDPIFVWSGANRVHGALLRRQKIVDLGAATRSEYTRAKDRPGTYNLMTDAATMQAIAAKSGSGGAPPPHFEYRSDTIGLPPTARPAKSFTVEFPSVTARWDWDAAAGGWLRTQDGTAHLDADGVQVMAANVIVAEVKQVSTGAVDIIGSTVYEEQFLGSGRAWVFTDGQVVEATWTKPSIDSVATWTTPDGIPVALTPGVTWIELAPGPPGK